MRRISFSLLVLCSCSMRKPRGYSGSLACWSHIIAASEGIFKPAPHTHTLPTYCFKVSTHIRNFQMSCECLKNEQHGSIKQIAVVFREKKTFDKSTTVALVSLFLFA
ncbi:hypothetical protein XENORESO_017441 [Xenotaenia resolanae]|uniref:Secreted protein n=1 Tax=Xenotaenia resolanae TaxID=208358 RepID=A0ABV0WIG3_9TELE